MNKAEFISKSVKARADREYYSGVNMPGKFDGRGTIYPDVLIWESGEVVDFVKYYNQGAHWVGARTISGPYDYWGPYVVAFNVERGMWVAYTRKGANVQKAETMRQIVKMRRE